MRWHWGWDPGQHWNLSLSIDEVVDHLPFVSQPWKTIVKFLLLMERCMKRLSPRSSSNSVPAWFDVLQFSSAVRRPNRHHQHNIGRWLGGMMWNYIKISMLELLKILVFEQHMNSCLITARPTTCSFFLQSHVHSLRRSKLQQLGNITQFFPFGRILSAGFYALMLHSFTSTFSHLGEIHHYQI